MPHVIMIAGPNGAGKTTAAPGLLNGLLGIEDFVNADAIAGGLSAFNPEGSAMVAGRIMLVRLRELAAEAKDFAFETTLASRSFAPWIARLRRESGYHLTLFYLWTLWTPAPEFNVARVAQRANDGGHRVPPAVVIRRYLGGLRNFFDLYRPIADHWTIFDNASPEGRYQVAEGVRDESLNVYDSLTWDSIQRQVRRDQGQTGH